MKELVILTPVWNDWDSLETLIGRLDDTFGRTDIRLRIVAVDDGSQQPIPPSLSNKKWKAIYQTKVLHLAGNFGSQKAIAIGLGYLSREIGSAKGVIVMDSDGEDVPEFAPRLLERQQASNAPLVVAIRGRRSEGTNFRLFYAIYKFIFRIATGHWLRFGNFMYLTPQALQSMAYSNHTAVHVAASVIKNRMNFESLRIDRGVRYAGKSSMSFVSLVLHGITAFAVFGETVMARALVLLGGLSLLAISGIGAVVAIRLFTAWGIPGWATYVSLGLLAMLVQAVLGMLTLGFLLVTYRQMKPWIPALDYDHYIRHSSTL